MADAGTSAAASSTDSSSSSSSAATHTHSATAQLRSKPIAAHPSAIHAHHSTSSAASSSSKRVSFDPTPPSSLSDGLLSNSFESSSVSIPLATMSDQRLTDKQSKKPAYSSLAAEDDDDGPPPLESAEVADDHASCSGHGHSHGGSSSSSSSSKSPHSAHNNHHPRSPSTPGTPKRSPIDNCGGMKGRKSKKTLKAEEANRKARRQLMWASACCCVMMVAEIVGGLLANSLAIMTDAAHLLSDLAGFLISIFALWLATRPATSRLSFGFHRAEILGALISVLLIWVLTGILVYEACWRLAHPEDVDGKIMFIVATCGLVVNFTMGMILLQGGHGHSHGLGGGGDHGHSHGGGSKKKKLHHKSHKSHHALNDDAEDDHGHSHAGGGDHGHSHGGGDEYKGLTDETHVQSSHDAHDHHAEVDHPEEENLNVKAAFIHVLGDALQSVGVMIAAALIWWKPEWRIADPLCTFLFSILVLFTTTRLIRQSVAVLMEGVPEGIEPDDVEEALLSVPGVIAVHDLHIWSLSVGKPSLSVHLYCRDDASHVLAAANKMCAAKYNIHHSTIQVERQHDDIECNDAFKPGHASLDRIASENFAELGITQV